MSAEGALSAALGECLAGVAGLNRVEPGASVRATPPFAEVGPVEARDWGTKDAVAAMPRAYADDAGGWRVASLTFVRSRTASEKAGLWAATMEWRVRVLAN